MFDANGNQAGGPPVSLLTAKAIARFATLGYHRLKLARRRAARQLPDIITGGR